MRFGRLQRWARRRRARVGLLAVVVCLAGAVVVTHSALGERHMGHGIAMCLAVMGAGGAALLARTTWTDTRRAPRGPVVRMPALAVVIVRPPVARARAAPAVLQVFRW